MKRVGVWDDRAQARLVGGGGGNVGGGGSNVGGGTTDASVGYGLGVCCTPPMHGAGDA